MILVENLTPDVFKTEVDGVLWSKSLSSTRPDAERLVNNAMVNQEYYGFTHYAVVLNTPEKYQVILGRIV